jgi:hypothetical protein
MRTKMNVNNNKKLHISKTAFISNSLLQVSIVKATFLRKKIRKINVKI